MADVPKQSKLVWLTVFNILMLLAAIGAFLFPYITQRKPKLEATVSQDMIGGYAKSAVLTMDKTKAFERFYVITVKNHGDDVAKGVRLYMPAITFGALWAKGDSEKADRDWQAVRGEFPVGDIAPGGDVTFNGYGPEREPKSWDVDVRHDAGAFRADQLLLIGSSTWAKVNDYGKFLSFVAGGVAALLAIELFLKIRRLLHRPPA